MGAATEAPSSWSNSAGSFNSKYDWHDRDNNEDGDRSADIGEADEVTGLGDTIDDNIDNSLVMTMIIMATVIVMIMTVIKVNMSYKDESDMWWR